MPLLFPHSVYKSYPESFLIEEKWDRLGKWLGTVSPYPISPIETSDIADIDDWIDRLAAKGHYVSCSSGTTGKSAMLLASDKDMDWSRKDTVSVFAWGSGVQPARDRRMIGSRADRRRPEEPGHRPGAAGRLRRSGQGALPAADPADHRRLADQDGRAAQEDRRRHRAARGDWPTSSRPPRSARRRSTRRWSRAPRRSSSTADEKLYHLGPVERAVPGGHDRPRHGVFRARTSTPTTASTSAAASSARSCRRTTRSSSTRRSTSRPAGTSRTTPCRNSTPACPSASEGDRYHVPPWIVPFILDEEGDALLPHETGEIEGRAAFFDLSLDGRWGGVITGDKISLDFSPCACGMQGPVDPQQHRPLRRPPGRRQDRLRRHRRRLRARPVMNAVNADRARGRADVHGRVSAPFFLRGELVEGQDAVHRSRDLASPSRRRGSTWTGWCTPRTEVPPLLERPARGDHRLPRRDRPAAPHPGQPLRAGMHRPHGRHPRAAAARAREPGQGRGGLSRQATAARAWSSRTSPIPAALDELGAEAGLHRAQELRARLRAPADPRAAGQLPGRRGEVRSPRARWSRRSTCSRCPRAIRSPRVAVLRTMAEIDPDHAIVKSMSAVYWRGGDERSSGRSTVRSTSTRSSPGAAATRSTTSSSTSVPASSWCRSTPRRRSRWSAGRPSSDEALDAAADSPPPTSWCSTRRPASPAGSSSSRGTATTSTAFCARLHDRLGVDRATASGRRTAARSRTARADRACSS